MTLRDPVRIFERRGDVAELADAQVSEACDGDIVEVQVLSSPPRTKGEHLGSPFLFTRKMERGHPVRLSAKRELALNVTGRLSVLRTLADRMSALHQAFTVAVRSPALTVGLIPRRLATLIVSQSHSAHHAEHISGSYQSPFLVVP